MASFSTHKKDPEEFIALSRLRLRRARRSSIV